MEMRAANWLAAGTVLASSALAPAQDPPAAPAEAVRVAAFAEPALKSARSRVSAVTVYQGNALVTREVEVPDGKGMIELVVTPLPPQTIDSSLYSEGTNGTRVLTTRYRSRAVKEDTRKEVRAKEEQIKRLQLEAQRLQKEVQVIEQNLQMLGKLENFTAATMQQLTEKGLLSSDTTIKLSKYIMEARAEKSAAQVELQQKIQANTEATAFATRELGELTAGSSRTERDAVIVIDKTNAGPGRVRLNYLVGAATWRPQYRFRAGGEKESVQLQYLASVEQQTGEDWTGVDMVLSTAQPMLNATPPELLALDVTVTSRAAAVAGQQGQQQQPGQMATLNSSAGAGMAGFGADGAALGRQFRDQSLSLRKKAQKELIDNNVKLGGVYINEAAALEQCEELLVALKKDEAGAADAKVEASASNREGPSVTYHLRARLTVPSRNDQQLIEVARLDMTPDYFYKAVPVLTPHVYRLANLTNKSEYVLLPGEATMYVGTDFVGRMNLPLVAIGEQYTVGFGVDPQLQVSRRLLKKTRSVQGGNQVHSYDYRITVNSYKSTPVKVQVWDRLPRAEADAVAVSLVEPSPKLSQDSTYQRVERPDNLLRWDLTVEPGMTGEKAATVAYQFKLEYARDVAIGNFKAKQ
jgi:hypothetical protein